MIIYYILLFLSNILLSTSYYVKTVLLKTNFFQLIFYFANGKEGVGNITSVIEIIKTCLYFFLTSSVITILPILIIKYFKLLPLKKFIKKYTIILLVFSTLLTLKNYQLDKYIYYKLKKTNIYEKYYVDTNKVKVTAPSEKNNLILIYLESMETSLISKENGGTFTTSRIPELETILKENTNFSNTDKFGGPENITVASFTMGSLVSSSSATPVDINLFRGYSKKNIPLKNVITLGDILKENNYNLKLIQGSPASFAGTDLYYKEHGNYEIIDYNKMKEKKYIDKDYQKWWGVEDKKLFEIAKKEILKSSESNKPFAVTLFTMDTHFKDGYLDEDCVNKYETNLSNVYACSSKRVNDFINWIKSNDFYKNTTIVVLGDHLTMQNSYYNGYKNFNRTIYNAFINSKQKEQNNKNRHFNNFDLYPTILASLGFEIEGNKLGFGTNLYSGEKTLTEKLGSSYVDKELLKRNQFYD